MSVRVAGLTAVETAREPRQHFNSPATDVVPAGIFIGWDGCLSHRHVANQLSGIGSGPYTACLLFIYLLSSPDGVGAAELPLFCWFVGLGRVVVPQFHGGLGCRGDSCDYLPGADILAASAG